MEFRKAAKTDLVSIIRLLADDDLGVERECSETSAAQSYLKAFENIEKQNGNMIILAVDNETVIDLAQENGCGIVQLFTNQRRVDAHRFYEDLGFIPTHIGMKLDLDIIN